MDGGPERQRDVKDLRLGRDEVPRFRPFRHQRRHDVPESGLNGSANHRDATLRLTVPADPRYIGLARLCVAGVAASADARIDEVDDLRMAVTEACQWLLDGTTGGSLELSVRRTVDGLEGSVAAYPGPGAGAVHEPSVLSRTILSSTVDRYEMVVNSSCPRCLFAKRLQPPD